ncbi:DUF1629 domain-containing protein [Xanthomonas sp. WHRI 10064A]|uniref:imm11 family protein n=1 Tax=unclassified Xanthomonas TaxID=2643310 RepID=UPI002B227C9D|nr:MULTISPECIES: DUF1629 domain-containing protein [unclassified Xanthomonas]MEA9589731.1 DUF1629 domain-containing protein [Xanthomonas sp. WHRI 10064B]MEA9617383.1 DUF1629 domain-containing protein [Xanthomonas sp. WHRI 10064A]
MRYYLMWQDVSIKSKWILDDIGYVNNWNFIDPPVNFMEPGGYSSKVRFDGFEVDYSLAGYASVPVLSKKAVDSLMGLPEIDEPYRNVVFAPVEIERKILRQNYFAMIIETQIDCVDEVNSEFSVFEKNDPVRPDLAGTYRNFFNLVIDVSKVGEKHIFRLKKYLGAVIVSEEVKRRFEGAEVTGVAFDLLNGPEKVVA